MKDKDSTKRHLASRDTSGYTKRPIARVRARGGNELPQKQSTAQNPTISTTHKKPIVTSHTVKDAVAQKQQYGNHRKSSRLTDRHTQVNLNKHHQTIMSLPALPKPTRNWLKRIYKWFLYQNRLIKTGIATFLIVVFCVLVVAVVISIHHAFTKTDLKSADQSSISTQDITNYSVAPDMPKYIKINSIGVWSRVFAVSSNQETLLALPNKVYDAGWYEKSAKPGQKGLSIFIGQVVSHAAKSIYADTNVIKVDSTIEITMGDNTVYRYKVVAAEPIISGKIDTTKVTKVYDSSKPNLNLVVMKNATNSNKTAEPSFIAYAVEVD